MSDTNDTSAIDEKKEQDPSEETYASKVIGFVISIIALIIIVLLYFSSSALILFVCKLAQANILPTEPNCSPYTNAKPTINPSPINTNIFATFTDPEMSMKLEIPYDEYNSSHKIIDMFRKYKENSSSNFLANYFISIAESLMQFDYSLINTIMNSFNSSLPESVIVGLGPIFVAFLFSFGVLLNGIYFIYLWFSNMRWFLKTNANKSGEGKPQWEDVTIISPLNFGIGIGLIILFIILFFIGFPFVSFMPFSIICLTSFTCLFYKGKINGGKLGMSFSMIKEILKYYKLSVVIAISIFVVLLGFSKLGVVSGIISIIIIGLIYWGIISINIFSPIKETNLTPSVSYEQAKKMCSNVIKNADKHGFLYNLAFGQKGGNLTKQLKKIGHNLQN
jgi:hypothetical protein